MNRPGGSLPRYRAVLLDAGGTILGPRTSYGAVYARVFEALGVHRTPEQFDAAMSRTRAEIERRLPRGSDRYGAGPGGENGYWLLWVRNVLRRLEPTPEDPGLAPHVLPLLRDAFLSAEAWVVWPDVRPALAELRRLGVRMAVVSNWDSRLPRLLERLDLRDRVDALAVSSLEGMEKPHPGLFRIALDRLGVSPWEAVHVGDTPDLDLEGAFAAGIDAILIDRGSVEPNDGALRDLGDLPRLAWGGPADAIRVRSAPPPT